MAQVEIADGRLTIRMDRSDRLWAFRGQLEVPLAYVRGGRGRPQRAQVPWSGLPIHDARGWATTSASPAWSSRSTTRPPWRRRSARPSTAAAARRPAERPPSRQRMASVRSLPGPGVADRLP